MRIHTYQCLPGAVPRDGHCAARERAGPVAAEGTAGNLAASWSVVAGKGRATLKIPGRAMSRSCSWRFGVMVFGVVRYGVLSVLFGFCLWLSACLLSAVCCPLAANACCLTVCMGDTVAGSVRRRPAAPLFVLPIRVTGSVV